ncbi:ABC transporter permease [Streptomyces mobaraensis]|uniref:ABC transporter permease n=1 Tax=Streptomyces mobaraensis TaxID=35621 RepID=A0A5N5WAB7_STRMB|nr:ABC transporter permease [Streptomyces mobaraensis]KAB7847800.1 ABC transporter permease [Streptomyces mobaraensis]
MDVVSRTWTWLATGSHWSGPDGVWHRLAEHLELTVVCLALSCAVALPLAVVLGHTGRGGALAVNLSNAGRAVPTFAVLVLLTLGPLGTYDSWPTVIALVLFAIPPLLTNAYVGMREVDRDVVEAARGMGMSGRQVIGRVELPLAMPLVMTGVRSAAVQVVATVSIAAIVGGGGLGRIITAGFRLTDTPQVVAGAVLVAALALVVEGAFVLLERWLGRRRRRGAAGADRISGVPGADAGPVTASAA